jgi:hypothetical protein
MKFGVYAMLLRSDVELAKEFDSNRFLELKVVFGKFPIVPASL